MQENNNKESENVDLNSKKDFSNYFSEAGFWKKIKSFTKEIGKDVIENALLLFYALFDSTTPHWAKGIILGALGYFIFPFDAIPDFIPLLGYSDDFGIIAAAIMAVSKSISEESKSKAKERASQCLGK